VPAQLQPVLHVLLDNVVVHAVGSLYDLLSSYV
jgi:hypothetical protein